MNSLWQEDSPMPDRPLTVHCSGLGGGLLSPDHEYDLFFQNHAQMKVYGPSLAMTDDWEQHITQLGLTKTTHEYAIYQLLSTAVGWGAWKEFLPDRFANLKLLITRHFFPFFRPTPYGFRQVVQHVSNHVAYGIN